MPTQLYYPKKIVRITKLKPYPRLPTKRSNRYKTVYVSQNLYKGSCGG